MIRRPLLAELLVVVFCVFYGAAQARGLPLRAPFRIVLPPAPVRPGSSFDIEIICASGDCRLFLMSLQPGAGWEFGSGPNRFVVQMPEDRCGTYRFLAGCGGTMQEFELLSAPDPLQIQSLGISAPSVMRLGTNASVHVYASMKDGRRVDVSDRAVGTSYAITDASVAELREDGTIHAARVGRTTFGATLFGFAASCDIEVVP